MQENLQAFSKTEPSFQSCPVMSRPGSPKAEPEMGIQSRFLLKPHVPSSFLCAKLLLSLAFSCKVTGGLLYPHSSQQVASKSPPTKRMHLPGISEQGVQVRAVSSQHLE